MLTTILLVEDNASDHLLLKKQLKDSNLEYKLTWKKTLEKSLLYLQENTIDVVLLDLNLPDSNGIDTINELYKKFPDIPIIVLSQLDDEDLTINAIKENAQDYLIKGKYTSSDLTKSINFARERKKLLLKLKKKNLLLEKNEKRFKHLVMNNADGTLVVNNNGEIIFANPKAYDLFCKQEEELIGLDLGFLANDQNKNTELELLTPQGTIPVAINTNELDWFGEDATLVTIRDITDELEIRNKLEEYKNHLEVLVENRTNELSKTNLQLSHEKERLQIIIDSIGEALIVTNNKGHILLLNHKAEQMFDCKFIECKGKPINYIYKMYNEDNNVLCVPTIYDALNKRTQIKDFFNRVLKLPEKPDRFIQESSNPVIDKNGKLFGGVSIFRDVTEERWYEEQLITTQKMKSISVLAGGIAHDFNNILTIIINNLTLSKLMIRSNENRNSIEKKLSEIEDIVFNAKNLTQQLLTFAKTGEPIKSLVNLSELINDNVNFALSGSNVKADITVDKKLWQVEVDEGQISQVINNLVINAIDAMPDGGILDIRLSNEEVADINPLKLKSGNYVTIVIRDYGIGIPNENLEKIFDPYFTTKTSGTGLGLAVSFTIIEKHKGIIFVESDVGVGTTFTIYLPATDKTITSSGKKKKTRKVKSMKARILLLEDDVNIIETLGSILEYYGITVIHAVEGYEAIKIYKESLESKKPIDLVIIDLTLPGGLGGYETFMKLKEIDENVKAVVSTGYSDNPILTNHKELGFMDTLNKPYKLNKLLDLISKSIKNK